MISIKNTGFIRFSIFREREFICGIKLWVKYIVVVYGLQRICMSLRFIFTQVTRETHWSSEGVGCQKATDTEIFRLDIITNSRRLV